MTAELEPVAQQWAAFEYGMQKTSWMPSGFGDEAGWNETSKRYEFLTVEYRPLVTLSSAQEAIDKREERIAELERQPHYVYIGKDGKAVKARDLEDRAEAAEARVKELEAALDEKEIASGLTSDGNLWRFWSAKATRLAVRNGELDRRASALQALLDEVGEVIEPFAGYVVPDPDPNSVSGERFGTKPDLKAFRAARSLAAKIKEAKG